MQDIPVNGNAPELQSGDSNMSNLGLFDILLVLARHKLLIIVFPLLAAIGAVAVSFALPNVYRANTKLLPPQGAQSGAAALLQQLGGVASMAAGVGGLKNPNDLYVGMLKSRTVADRLVAQFDLKKVYDIDSLEKTRKLLEDNTHINAGKDGLITIDVEDHDRKRAAELANAYVAELFSLSKTMAVTEASQRRLFYERQLETAKNNLAAAEKSLKSGMDAGGVVSVDVESRGILETIAKVKAEISAREIKINSMRAFVTPTHPDYRRTEEELASLRIQLGRLENGRGTSSDAATSTIGDSGLDNVRLLRDVKYYQMLYELLAKQYEAARLDEARDPAVIQVLDRAVEPERKVKPVRALIGVLSGMLAFFLAVAWAFISEGKRRLLQSPGTSAKWKQLQDQLGVNTAANP